MPQIKIAGKADIENSGDQWNELVRSMGHPNIFLTWEWITNWINVFGKDYEMMILYIYDGSDLAAIFPLAKKRMKWKYGYLRSDVVVMCGSVEISPDHMDIICSKDADADRYISASMEFLKKNARQDITCFYSLAKDGKLASWLDRNGHRHRGVLVNRTVSHYADLENGFEDFMGRMKSKKRYNLFREKKRLYKEGIDLKMIESHGEVEAAFDNFIELHRKNFDHKKVESLFVKKGKLDFHRSILRTFMDSGRLGLYLLKKGETPVAAMYGFKFENIFYIMQMGMDPKWHRLSPGKVLILSVLDKASREGFTEFDFLRGEEGYKKYWAKEHRELVTYVVFNNTILSNTEYLIMRIEDTVKLILKKLMLFEAVKKIIK